MNRVFSYLLGVILFCNLVSRAMAVVTIALNDVPPPPPVIYSFTPTYGVGGTVVTLTGTNFSANKTSDLVFFGAVQANVLAASPTNLTVTVPVGATYAPITVNVFGLLAYADAPFLPTFAGNGSGLNMSNFAARLDLPAPNGPGSVIIVDIDGDGKPDVVFQNSYSHCISIYRNISTGGTLTTNSFAPRIDVPTTQGTYSPGCVTVADVDGDGRPDLVVPECSDNLLSVFRNTSTPGNISFAARVDFPAGQTPQAIALQDLDGDGRPDIMVVNAGDGTVSIFQNLSTPGTITTNSLAPRVDLITGSTPSGVAAGDLTGDGKPDLVTVNDGTLSLFQNIISLPGTITTNSFAARVDLVIPAGGQSVKIADVDGDGLPDLVASSYLPQTVSVLRNTGAGGALTTDSFAPYVSFPLAGRGTGLAVGDLEGDGELDIAVDSELNSLLSVFSNVSTPGTFTTNSLTGPVELATGSDPAGVAIADLDGDGRPDIITGNYYDNTVSIYQNEMPFNSESVLPFISTEPASQSVVEGGEVDLSVVAGGSGTLSYQWNFNGKNIPGATSDALTLTNIHPSQAGNYAVTVTNANGSVTSSPAAITVIQQTILIYSYSGNEAVTTLGSEISYNLSGQLFFIPATTNAVFVGWADISNKKQYWVSQVSDYLLITIPGSANHSYTLFGTAGSGIDGNGRPYLWSLLHRGQNANLLIGTKKYFSFPNTFVYSGTQAYADGQTGDMVLQDATSNYTYQQNNTLTANNNGETVTDLVSALLKSLAKQGYQPQ